MLTDLCASSYSGPFASQWIWCLVILVGWPFAPESPWFLIRRGRFDEAENALRRLASKKVDVKPAMAMMIEVSSFRIRYTDAWHHILPYAIVGVPMKLSLAACWSAARIADACPYRQTVSSRNSKLARHTSTASKGSIVDARRSLWAFIVFR